MSNSVKDNHCRQCGNECYGTYCKKCSLEKEVREELGETDRQKKKKD